MSQKQNEKNTVVSTTFNVPRLSLAECMINSWEPQFSTATLSTNPTPNFTTSTPSPTPTYTPKPPIFQGQGYDAPTPSFEPPSLPPASSPTPSPTPNQPLAQRFGLLDYTPTPTYTPRGPTENNIDQRLLDNLEKFYQLREGGAFKSHQFTQLKSPFECETEDEGGDEVDEVGAGVGVGVGEDMGKFMSKHNSDMSQFLRQRSAGLLKNHLGNPWNSFSYPLNSFLSNFSVRNEEEDPHFVNFASALSDSKTYSLPLQQQQQERVGVQAGGGECVGGDGKEEDGDIDGTLGKRSSYVKQKNREAQRRFRAKQKKKISELQLLVSVLQQESGTLLSENKHLKGQNNSLVQEVELLKMENEQLRSLLVRDFIQQMVKTRAAC